MRSFCSALVSLPLLLGCAAQDAPSSESEPGPRFQAISETAEEITNPMPDLIGLTENEARQALRDQAIDPPTITTDTQESFKSPGTVLQQIPTAGGRLAGSISLTVAKPMAPVPKFEGRTIDAVLAWASARDIEVTQVMVPDAFRPQGEVISVTPESGEMPSSEIVVEVSESPEMTSLNFDDAIESDCDYSVREVYIDGEPYPGTLIYSYGECVADFNLGRDAQKVLAVVGQSDESDSESRARVRFLVDGVPEFDRVISFNERPAKINIPVVDALRLRIHVGEVGEGSAEIGIGALRLVGQVDKADDE